MNEKDYVPILKAKQGELDALKHLDDADKENMTPLLEMADVPLKFEKGKEPRAAKTLDKHLEKQASLIAKAWGLTREIFLDFDELPATARLADGSHPVARLLEDARKEKLLAIPVVCLESDSDRRAATKGAVGTDKRGTCVRLFVSDFDDLPDLDLGLTDLLSAIGTGIEDVDLLLDLRDAPSTALARNMIRDLPNVAKWRSVVVAGTSMPKTAGGYKRWSINPVKRVEWGAWKNLQSRGAAARKPTFGDYGIGHPDPGTFDPRKMTLGGKIRYTVENDYLFSKGMKLGDDPAQFRRLSKDLVKRPDYSGKKFSWGDGYIADCSAGGPPGNLKKWVEATTNHHLKFVTAQISNFP